MTPSALLDALRLPGRTASLLPVVMCGAFLLLVLASGAPGAPPDAGRARRAVEGLGAGPTVLILRGPLLVALLLDPLQLRLVRWLEGDWRPGPAFLTRWFTDRRRRHRAELASAVRPRSGVRTEVPVRTPAGRLLR
ncbi:hypothetical protein [Streptomyces sp. NPDC051561]|uniref:hypothetical protein n=1 Tax=Streptomyces sp. NPDC051561 TaxID=3365658 RepID=UPI0037AFD82F